MYCYYSDICIVDNEQGFILTSTETVRIEARTQKHKAGIYYQAATNEGNDKRFLSTMSNYPAASYATLNSAILPSARTRLIYLNPVSFVVYGGLSGTENGLDTVFYNSDIRFLTGRAMRAKEYWVLHDNPIQFPVTWDSVNIRNVPQALVDTPIARCTTGFVNTKINTKALYQVVKKCGQAISELQARTLQLYSRPKTNEPRKLRGVNPPWTNRKMLSTKRYAITSIHTNRPSK